MTLPASRGGNLFVTAICTVFPGFQCDQNVGGSDGYWARGQVNAAHLLLSNAAAPEGTAFSGSALQPHARGVAHLVFTATDANGPGIYTVSAAIDGRSVFNATPNTNDGACVPVGTDASGALMFDSQQPCPATEVVDVPVPTTGFPDGSHALAVTVTDAAHNSSTVLDQNITTSNPLTTPNPSGRRAIHARFTISWRWNDATTTLRSIRVQHLPRYRARGRSLCRQALPAAAGRRHRSPQGGGAAKPARRPPAERRPDAADHRHPAPPRRRADRVGYPQRTDPAGEAVALMTARSIRLTTVAGLMCALFACASAARAGTWMQVSCVNPDGTAAPSEGWTLSASTPADPGGIASTQCSPGTPMLAELSVLAGAPANSAEYLSYQPPAGSTLVDGSLNVIMSADGYGSDSAGSAAGVAGLYEPSLAAPFFRCVAFSQTCGPTPNFSGVVSLPKEGTEER